MQRKIIPSSFWFKALVETRRIKQATLNLREKIQILQEEGEDGEQPEFYLPGFEELSYDLNPYHDPELLQAIIDEHFPYQERFVKDIGTLSRYIPSSYIACYRDLVSMFDEEIHRIDPTYPSPKLLSNI